MYFDGTYRINLDSLKILIFGQVKRQSGSQNIIYSTYGHTFLAISRQFFVRLGLIFFGDSEDYYLSIGDEKS